jgi:hypothetical protein
MKWLETLVLALDRSPQPGREMSGEPLFYKCEDPQGGGER